MNQADCSTHRRTNVLRRLSVDTEAHLAATTPDIAEMLTFWYDADTAIARTGVVNKDLSFKAKDNNTSSDSITVVRVDENKTRSRKGSSSHFAARDREKERESYWNVLSARVYTLCVSDHLCTFHSSMLLTDCLEMTVMFITLY